MLPNFDPVKLAPYDILPRLELAFVWSVLWALVAFGVALLLGGILLHLTRARENGVALLLLIFGGGMMGQRFFIGAACLFRRSCS